MAYASPVTVVATSNIGNLSSPGSTFDGVTLSANPTRILLTWQTITQTNGVWLWHTGTSALTRPTGTDQYATTNTLDNNTLIPVTSGNTYAGTVWGVDPGQVIKVDTTSHTLTRVALPPVQARVASPGINISISGCPSTIDGVGSGSIPPLTGNGGLGSDVVLLKDQSTPSQNGLWYVNTSGGAMTRLSEPLPPARQVDVSEGAINAHTNWALVTQGLITVGTTALTFSRQLVRANVKDFGAFGNGGNTHDGQTTSGSTTLTSPSALFTAANVPAGTPILVVGAGTNGANLITTATYATSTTVTLAASASTTITGSAVIVWGTDDSKAIAAAINAMSMAGGALLFPPGVYVVGGGTGVTAPANVQVTFEERAMLSPFGESVTLNGRVTGHPTQQIFGGAGVLPATVSPSGSGPSLNLSGNPTGTNAFVITITTGSSPGPVTFSYSLGGSTIATGLTGPNSSAAYIFPIPATGVTAMFPASSSYATGTYSWSSTAAIALSAAAADKLSVKWWGATGNGTTDDTTAVQTFLNLCLAAQAPAYFPQGQYVISSTIALTFGNGSGGAFFMFGAMGTTYPAVTSFSWNGALGGSMFEQTGGSSFNVRDIDFNGNGLANDCYWMVPSSSKSCNNCKFDRCSFTSPRVVPFWLNNTPYVIGNYVVGPNTGDIFASHGVISNNGYMYECTANGTSNMGGPANTWPTTIGGPAFTDNGTLMWRCVGYSSACFRVGTDTTNSNQVSECVWEQCSFIGGTSGWRQQGYGNVKNFQFNHCTFYESGYGFDVAAGSGSYSMQFPTFDANSASDINFTGDNLVVEGFSSEGSARLMTGSAGEGVVIHVTLIGGYWAGTPLPYIGLYPVIYSTAMVTAINTHFSATVSSSLAPVLVMIDGANNATAGAGYTSIGCTYDATSVLYVTDSGGNIYPGIGSQLSAYPGEPIRIVSLNDAGNVSGSGSSSVPFGAYIGADLKLGTRKVPTRISAALSTSSVVLAAAQYECDVLVLTGTITAAIELTFPNTAGLWAVDVSGLSLSGSGSLTLVSGSASVLTLHSNPDVFLMHVSTSGSNGMSPSYFN